MSGFNGVVRMRALEIEDELVAAVKAAGPNGLTFRDGCDLFGMEYNEFYGAAHELAQLKRIKIALGLNGHRHNMVMPGQPDPAYLVITEKQRRVLDYLISRSDERGVVSASRKEIRDNTGCSDPTFVLDRLDRKGYLQWIDAGGPSRKATFKMYPYGNGPQGSSSWPFTTGRPPMFLISKWLQEMENDAR
jgi:hypothetical protein